MSPNNEHITQYRLKALAAGEPAATDNEAIAEPNTAEAQDGVSEASVPTPSPQSTENAAYVEELTADMRERLVSSMIQLVDGLFDILQMSAYEINKGTQGTELEMTWSRPTLEKASSSNWLSGQVEGMSFTGRMSTRYWTLILKGAIPEILAYVIPSEKLLSFNTNPEIFQPYMCLASVITNEGVAWCIEDFQITAEHLPTLTKHLMETLIKYAQNRGSGSTRLSLASLGIAKPKRSANNESEIERRYRQKLLNQLASFSGVDLLRADSGNADLMQAQGQLSINQKPLYAMDTVVDAAPFDLGTTNAAPGMPQALNQLLKVLDCELDNITKAGATAFEARDMTRAQAILVFTNRLTEFKQLATALYRDYQEET